VPEVFDAYAEYYDLLYKDKDYASESEYVSEVIRRHRPNARALLELGSGAGRHAGRLAQSGYTVHGVERSQGMLEQARRLHPDAAIYEEGQDVTDFGASLSFSLGDLRTVRLGQTFDAVISLFHVFSYLSTNEALAAGFATAATHLNPGGVLVFDCWYGPAVLTDLPQARDKHIESELICADRHTEIEMDFAENVVNVAFDVTVTNRRENTQERFREVHPMRYLFIPEIDMHAAASGFRRVAVEEWLTGKPPTEKSWGVCFVLRRL